MQGDIQYGQVRETASGVARRQSKRAAPKDGPLHFLQTSFQRLSARASKAFSEVRTAGP